mmetsp:Transcript_34097/g.38359  ORF Transcript_34097/g.38359 Transcript_34097/m.38359 type:complete len:303 (-) Transcript_34097:151-1059(-)
MKTASSPLLLLIAAVFTIDTAHAITRRLGSTHHNLDLAGSSPSPSSSSSSRSRSISALGLKLSDTATIARAQQERRRRYSPATSSNKSTTSTASSKSSPAAEQVRGGGVKNIKKQFGEGVCVDNEGNLYSSPSSFSASTLIAASALKVRGGGVCVDNEGNFYSPRSQPQQEQIQRPQQPSLASANHRQTILASSKSSHSSSSTKTIIPASSGSKEGQLGLGLGRRRKTSSPSLSPSFRSPPPIRGGELKNNMNNKNKNRIGDLCVDQEGNLYSSLSTLRGGGNGGGSGGLCVDNEGNLYASR